MSKEQPSTQPPEWRAIPEAALRTRRAQFLAEADRLLPWQDWADLLEDHYPKKGKGRPPYPLGTMLRLFLLKRWFALADQGVQELATDSLAVRQFIGLGLVFGGSGDRVPDETTLLKFRQLLIKKKLLEEIDKDITDRLAHQGWKIRLGELVEPGFIACRS